MASLLLGARTLLRTARGDVPGSNRPQVGGWAAEGLSGFGELGKGYRRQLAGF